MRVGGIFVGGILLLLITSPALHADPLSTDQTEPDSLDGYIQSLSRWSDRSFSHYSLDVETVSPSVIDSLVAYYETTGEAPRARVVQEPDWDFSPRLAGLRYNRVEGLNLIPGASLRLPTRPRIDLLGEIGYGTASEELTWKSEVRLRSNSSYRAPTFSASYRHEVTEFGASRVFGNSMTALFLGEDYDDYYLCEGWNFETGVRPRGGRFGLSFKIEEHDSIATATQFALLHRGKPFRSNPAIDPGEVRELGLHAEWRRFPVEGVRVRFDGAISGDELGGDFSYHSMRLETVLRGTPWRGDFVSLRLTGGFVDGDSVPYQALYHLGGFRALRGYGINEIGARRFVHSALDYEIGTDLLRPFWGLRRLRIQFMPFFDAAALFETQERGEDPVTHSEPSYKFSTGVGLQKNFLGIPGGGGQVRVEVARRLDRGGDPMSYRVRITVER